MEVDAPSFNSVLAVPDVVDEEVKKEGLGQLKANAEEVAQHQVEQVPLVALKYGEHESIFGDAPVHSGLPCRPKLFNLTVYSIFLSDIA